MTTQPLPPEEPRIYSWYRVATSSSWRQVEAMPTATAAGRRAAAPLCARGRAVGTLLVRMYVRRALAIQPHFFFLAEEHGHQSRDKSVDSRDCVYRQAPYHLYEKVTDIIPPFD